MTTTMTTHLDAALTAALRFPSRHEQEAAARAALAGATLTQVSINLWLARHPGIVSRDTKGKRTYRETSDSIVALRVALVAEAMLRA